MNLVQLGMCYEVDSYSYWLYFGSYYIAIGFPPIQNLHIASYIMHQN